MSSDLSKPTTYSAEDVDRLFTILKQASSHSYDLGKNYFIRTVTMAYTGRLTTVTDTDLVLEDCAWVADTGRYNTFLLEGKANEVEPYPAGKRVIINRHAVIDASEWTHALFTKAQ